MKKLRDIVLQEIIDLDGDCMAVDRCAHCPFKTDCLSSFVKSRILSKSDRVQLALDVLLGEALDMDELSTPNFERLEDD